MNNQAKGLDMQNLYQSYKYLSITATNKQTFTHTISRTLRETLFTQGNTRKLNDDDFNCVNNGSQGGQSLKSLGRGGNIKQKNFLIEY
ncbi:unnamed protein product [Rhizophagus irregularis]|nr:unnamed protein product [Rhizophagus irregularis]CAB4407062.1 unnamed protein product [Rhizophagus irregularis]